MMRRLLAALVTGLVFSFSGPASAETAALDAVRTSVEAILETITNEQLDETARREQMRAAIEDRFDFRAMSQRTLATNWKKATDEEKQQFVELFSRLIENSYVGKIESYTNEKVEFPGARVKGKKAIVDTLIITASADIPVNYKLYLKGDEWLVYDVIIEGVSLINNYRSSYQEIVKKEGITGLLAKMQDKLDELASEPEGQPS
jgi:phospholipid transport system substrate-binding protein